MYEDLEKCLSKARLNRYYDITDNREISIQLHDWNIKLSQAFYPLLCYFEIFLRNLCNEILKREKGEFWYLDSKLLTGKNIKKTQETLKRIEEVCDKIRKNKNIYKNISNNNLNTDDIVSNLTCGFWVNLFNSNYHDTLWQKIFKFHSFHHKQQKDVYKILKLINDFRNRVFHYEPIIFDYDVKYYFTIISDLLVEILNDLNCKNNLLFDKINNECLETLKIIENYREFMKKNKPDEAIKQVKT